MFLLLLNELYIFFHLKSHPKLYDGTFNDQKVKRKGSQAKKRTNTYIAESIVPNTLKVSNAQGCKFLTDLSFTFYLPKLGHFEPLATLGFIFELFDSFKLFKMETKTIQKGDRKK